MLRRHQAKIFRSSKVKSFSLMAMYMLYTLVKIKIFIKCYINKLRECMLLNDETIVFIYCLDNLLCQGYLEDDQ